MTRSVHLLLREGVELLDFAGPGQVFAAAGYDVDAVAVRPGTVTSQGFLRVEPTGILFDGPEPDLLVVPGGNAEAGLSDAALIAALGRVRPGILFSVCTGALLLAAAGRLRGLEVTTWHGALDRLRAIEPGCTVVEGVRFVDNGDVVTSAGVSAGIDAALHLVKRLDGVHAAREAAHYMEYAPHASERAAPPGPRPGTPS
jgi:transcriptional regulator GlxA family with amidase domain